MRAMLGADDVGHHSLEGSRGKDGDLLWLPIICVEIKYPASSAPHLEASKMVDAEAARGVMWEMLAPLLWPKKPRWLSAPWFYRRCLMSWLLL